MEIPEYTDPAIHHIEDVKQSQLIRAAVYALTLCADALAHLAPICGVPDCEICSRDGDGFADALAEIQLRMVDD